MKEAYIAAKERWARKMAGQQPATPPRSRDRLPPGQHQVHEHGGPARVIIPKRYAWKGAKFVREITFLDRDILGFWEIRGYSNTADPWTEDRFAKKGELPPGFL
jgi:DMSO/TMAO reductase YedYZ molybdopterin-dependent catalytic subunit